MKKLKQNGMVIVASALALTAFSLLTIWFNRGLFLEAAQVENRAFQNIVGKNVKLSQLIQNIPAHQPFFVVGISQQDLPWSILRASYPDKVAASLQFQPVQKLYGQNIKAYRYRSRLDFLLLLERSDVQDVNYLSALDAAGFVTVTEAAYGPSLKLTGSLLFMIFSIAMVVRLTPKP